MRAGGAIETHYQGDFDRLVDAIARAEKRCCTWAAALSSNAYKDTRTCREAEIPVYMTLMGPGLFRRA
jgi:hypothetical protein